jgi:hypothetical protein
MWKLANAQTDSRRARAIVRYHEYCSIVGDGEQQTVRLESKDRELIAEVKLPANVEPDPIAFLDRVFIHRPMLETEPPKKDDHGVYFEATTHHIGGVAGINNIDVDANFSKNVRMMDSLECVYTN